MNGDFRASDLPVRTLFATRTLTTRTYSPKGEHYAVDHLRQVLTSGQSRDPGVHLYVEGKSCCRSGTSLLRQCRGWIPMPGRIALASGSDLTSRTVNTSGLTCVPPCRRIGSGQLVLHSV